MTTKEIRALLEEQKAAQAKYAEDLAKLNSGMYSKEYIAEQKAKLDSSYGSEKAARGKKTADMLTAYKAQIRGTVDLSDPALSNLIALTAAMGKDTPRSIMDSAIEHFKGNNTALKAISSIAKSNGVEYAAADRFIYDETAIDEAILAASKDIDRNNSLSPIGLALQHIEDVEAQQIRAQDQNSLTAAPAALY